VVVAVALTALLAELAFPQFLRFRGGSPEILLLVCAFISLYAAPKESLLACLGCGLLKDFFSVGRTGTYAIIFFIVALCLSSLRRYLYRERVLTQVAVGFAASFISNLLYIVFLNLFVSAFSFGDSWLFIFLISLYTGLISPIIFFLLGKIKGYLGISETLKVFY
jgi:rod shape-determining protein MreD